MRYEHDGCNGCESYYAESNELPCSICKGNVESSNPYYPLLNDFWKPAGKQDDVVNHPTHYTQGSVECIDAMKSAFGTAELAAYCKIAAFKYIWRCERKNGVEDVKKAIWYMNKYLELAGDTDENA